MKSPGLRIVNWPLWSPAARLMRRFRFPGKMALISAAFLLPVLWLLANFLQAERDFINLSVTNQGEPIDATDLPHLFDRFYRGRNAKHRPGSGLGLHLVQVVAAMHNGHVLAENLPTGHCRFTLVLARG